MRKASHIERLLLAALQQSMAGDNFVDVTNEWDTPIRFEADELGRSWPKEDSPFYGVVNSWETALLRQATIVGYDADVLIWSTAVTLVIECDGREFHERTVQQASYDRARDRALLRVGVDAVIRFTGSDIVRDANSCARESRETFETIVSKRDAMRAHWEGFATIATIRTVSERLKRRGVG